MCIRDSAYRIETAPQYMQGPLSSMYIAGYRVAMLVGGAGSLWLAAYFGQENYNQEVWQKVYSIMSIFMLIGIFGTLISKEPKIKKALSNDNALIKYNNELVIPQILLKVTND